MPGGGGLLQLVAKGEQDAFLTGNPQISFFKMVYRRHTNFAIESMRMYFDGVATFGKRITCTIPKRGDLLGPLFLEVTLPLITDESGTYMSYVNSIGHALIQEVSIEIGEQEIDKQTGEWMEMWSRVSVPSSQVDALNAMIGRTDGYVEPQNFGPIRLIIPLQLWFCRNPGLYLPLLALQYHPVRINIKLRSLQELFYTPALAADTCLQVAPAEAIDVVMWGDYVFLDKEERRRFVSVDHEYLIEQVQYTPTYTVPAGQSQLPIRLDFNHPIKELFWVAQRQAAVEQHELFNWSSLLLTDTTSFEIGRTDNLVSALLQVDGQDRFDERNAIYFRVVQPWQRHTTTPINSFIYMYSFALKPEDVQPTGTLNASRIDSLVLNVTLATDANTVPAPNPPRGACNVRVYAHNYNILRISDGYGGLLFRV
jgi:hypothetical protein